MLELVDVAELIGQPRKINPDLIAEVGVGNGRFWYLLMGQNAEDVSYSLSYTDQKTAEYEMEQFCRKLSIG